MENEQEAIPFISNYFIKKAEELNLSILRHHNLDLNSDFLYLKYQIKRFYESRRDVSDKPMHNSHSIY